MEQVLYPEPYRPPHGLISDPARTHEIQLTTSAGLLHIGCRCLPNHTHSEPDTWDGPLSRTIEIYLALPHRLAAGESLTA